MNASTIDEQEDRIGPGLAGAIGLHLLIAAAFIGVALYTHTSSDHWGENAAQTGAIQASMVSAIPLPRKEAPVDKSVLAPETVSPAPVPPPKEAAIRRRATPTSSSRARPNPRKPPRSPQSTHPSTPNRSPTRPRPNPAKAPPSFRSP